MPSVFALIVLAGLVVLVLASALGALWDRRRRRRPMVLLSGDQALAARQAVFFNEVGDSTNA